MMEGGGGVDGEVEEEEGEVEEDGVEPKMEGKVGEGVRARAHVSSHSVGRDEVEESERGLEGGLERGLEGVWVQVASHRPANDASMEQTSDNLCAAVCCDVAMQLFRCCDGEKEGRSLF